MRIPLFKPIFTADMVSAAIDALQNERFVLGESVYKFEDEFAKYVGTNYAVAVSSGTTALALSLMALNVNPHDKVLTTTVTFIATANVIRHVNGTPVFTDININTGNMELPTDKSNLADIKGIIPVHLYGNPCELTPILELRDCGKIKFVVEDACQAHGAKYRNKKVGSIGDVGCFSFYPSKNMTVGGDGGMITTDNEKVAETLRSLRDCGRISKHVYGCVGYTARLNTVNAAIGRVQLKYLDRWNEQRRKAAALYRSLLPSSMVLSETDYCVYHLFTIKVKNRVEVIKHLTKNGIEVGIYYPQPIHLEQIYRDTYKFHKGMFPHAETFTTQILSLPMYPEITEAEIKYVCEKILEVATP
jgi:perosamine synthetase